MMAKSSKPDAIAKTAQDSSAARQFKGSLYKAKLSTKHAYVLVMCTWRVISLPQKLARKCGTLTCWSAYENCPSVAESMLIKEFSTMRQTSCQSVLVQHSHIRAVNTAWRRQLKEPMNRRRNCNAWMTDKSNNTRQANNVSYTVQSMQLGTITAAPWYYTPQSFTKCSLSLTHIRHTRKRRKVKIHLYNAKICLFFSGDILFWGLVTILVIIFVNSSFLILIKSHI